MPEASRGRHRATGEGTSKDLRTVLDLLLDLASEDSAAGWSMVRKEEERRCADLQKALQVRWDANKPNHLLVTSTRKDPYADVDPHRGNTHSQKGTLEAIGLCLHATKRIPEGGNKNEVPKERIRNCLHLLKDLGLWEETSSESRTGSKRSNSAYWSFWIDLSKSRSRRKSDCLDYVDQCWQGLQKTKALERSANTPGAAVNHLAELDRWVDDHREAALRKFEAYADVRSRRIHVPLKARICWAADGKEHTREPVPEDFYQVVADQTSQMILIWEEGGAGKTSLAFQIARWGLEGKLDGNGRRLLPVLLDTEQGGEGLIERVRRQLCNLGDLDLSQTKVEQLLRHKRLLLIVDHFSELIPEDRQWVRNSLAIDSGSLVLLTSRQDESQWFKNWTISKIQPERLKDDELFSFFENYLKLKSEVSASDDEGLVLAPDDQTRIRELLERMVGNKPITVLLAWMVIDKALNFIQGGRGDLLPGSVPELMLDYVDRSGKAIPGPIKRFEDGTPIQDAWIEISLKALALAAHRHKGLPYCPSNFSAELDLAALLNEEHLKKIYQLCPPLESMEQRPNLLKYMEGKLNLLQRKGGTSGSPIYRIALDPLADYLAAMGQFDETRCNLDSGDQDHLNEVTKWLDHLRGELERGPADTRDRMSGFLSSCRDCYKDLVNGLPAKPDSKLWEEWKAIPFDIARLAGIDTDEEREYEARHLIRRHAGDLYWPNHELRPKAIAELDRYAREFRGRKLPELENAVVPLARTMAKARASVPSEDRAAAAEALGRIGGPRAAAELIRTINSDDEAEVAVRRAAAAALGLIADDSQLASEGKHWVVLAGLLANEKLRLHAQSDPKRTDALLPLLQGAARGLQRLASGRLPTWGGGPGLAVPVLTLTTAGGAVTTKVVDVEVWQLPLPGGLPLEVVIIPQGTYEIGSEQGGWDGPLRRVTVPTSLMARLPLTQAQWRTLADAKYELERELNPDPAQFKGPDLPVETVSWFEAQEWCSRLERYLKHELGERAPQVALPSESLWEVACRAGSTTPYHFGDAIDAAWVNHRPDPDAGRDRPGLYLGHTSAVGSYGLVNAWGLADMHGNVWEWCRDVWHASPLGGPTDGSAWDDPDDPESERLLRGGSWFDEPHDCRAACRDGDHPAVANNDVGFRPCCLLPPGSLLGS